MNIEEILVKSLALLILEQKKDGVLTSTGLVEELVRTTKRNNVKIPEDTQEYLDKLANIIDGVIKGELEPKDSLASIVELNLSNRPDLVNILNKQIKVKEEKDRLDKIINYLRNELIDTIKKYKLKKELLNALTLLNQKQLHSETIINNLIFRLNELSTTQDFKESGLVAEIDFDSEESIKRAIKKAKDLIFGGVYTTGWECINNMTQGGLRRGEFVTIYALQHNYKSGLTKSLFSQIVRLNKPIVLKKDKKPLVLFISLEEEIENIISFLFLYLKISIENKTYSRKELKNLPIEEMSNYVKEKLTEKGFSIRILRYDPSYFNYQKLEKLIKEKEASGYEVQAVFLDYVKKMDRSDIKESFKGEGLLTLYSKIRNFMSTRKILFVTPHQLDSDAKRLIKSGMPPSDFVKFIANKGFGSESKYLDQEIDLELFIHIGKINRESYLFIQRGKHRFPTNIPDKDKFTKLKFVAKDAPIPEDNDWYKPCAKDEDEIDEFQF